ncbi:hypothetical protein D3C83_270830 [compost metagenome]
MLGHQAGVDVVTPSGSKAGNDGQALPRVKLLGRDRWECDADDQSDGHYEPR